jgi:ABC-type Mn2+/Zn2+ transport system ATPase subunit
VSGPVVEARGVCVVREGRSVLEDVSFSLDAAGLLGVVGPNGAGKTTLLRAVLGLVPLASGEIRIFGDGGPGAARRAGGVGYVPQRQVIPARFPVSVRDAVAFGALAGLSRARNASARRERVRRSLEWVGIAHLAERPIGALSGGEQRRALLAQALCAGERLLLLDEPTTGLDLPAEQEFYGLLRRLKQELGVAILAVSHDLVALAGQADALICINRRMHVHGHPDAVIHSHAMREAYSCEFDFLAGELAHHEQIGSNLAPREERAHPHVHRQER